MKRLALVLLVALFSSVATAGPPDESGIVFRGTQPVLELFADWDSDLIVLLGGDPVEVCSDPEASLDFVAYQARNIRDGLRLAGIFAGSNVRAYVYRLSEVGYRQFCDNVLSKLPLATGEVNYRRQDNDYFGAQNCDVKENFNAFGRSFEGTLYSPDGRPRKFSGHDRHVWDCDNRIVVYADVKLSLTK